ncbi:MAG: HEAT repeat domain-containing protein [Desulfuromonadales bacterium]|nr:HEAT repeat domain-containing protein [Desulfuromonadales bacterium]MBN2791055.1 HEAT repeat domain-containing protein [Desulfuromonadales bacterium]
MNRQKDIPQAINPDKPLLSSFLHELNLSRRKLALYPTNHPQISTSTEKTLGLLNDLFHSKRTISLGITPRAILFEQQWLDKEDSANLEFARFFSSLGIASVSFHFGLQGQELIRFNQLLRSDRETIESFGGFERLLEDQQIEHVSVIPVDYAAFQSSKNLIAQQDQLWDMFLHGLQNGILDFGESDSADDISTVADLFNEKFSAGDRPAEDFSRSLDQYIEKRIQDHAGTQTVTETDRRFNSLLEQLTPEARNQIFSSIFRVLDRDHTHAPGLLKKLPSRLVHDAINSKTRQNLKISSRLFALATTLATGASSEFERKVASPSEQLSADMVRARLDVLFSEERQDLYMPSRYQAALDSMLSCDISGSIPEDVKLNLKEQLETQSTERNTLAILLDMLHQPIAADQENAIQQNLLELSRFFLDTGDFRSLKDIFQSWSRYLYGGQAHASIFDEKVLANHTQQSFMAEVIDAFELWEEDSHSDIIAYITTVGEPYSDLIIEQLGLAPTWQERRLLMQLLGGLGGDAQQKIIRALDDERWYLQRNLLTVLGKTLDPKNIKTIQQLCHHEHPQVRKEAVRILFICNPATANRQLLADLAGDDPLARLAAIDIADLSSDPKVLGLLHKTLEQDPGNDQELKILQATVRTLVRIGNQESLPIFRRVLKKSGLLVNRRIRQLQLEIIQGLGQFPGRRATQLLDELSTGKFKQKALIAREQRQ